MRNDRGNSLALRECASTSSVTLRCSPRARPVPPCVHSSTLLFAVSQHDCGSSFCTPTRPAQGPAPWRALVALSASTPCDGCARSARCSPCAPGKPTYPGRSALCLSAAVGVVAPTPVGRHCAYPPQSAQPVRSLKFLVRLFRPAELRCLFVNSRQERVWSPSRGDFRPFRGMPCSARRPYRSAREER